MGMGKAKRLGKNGKFMEKRRGKDGGEGCC
jgi:hypothetical protein